VGSGRGGRGSSFNCLRKEMYPHFNGRKETEAGTWKKKTISSYYLTAKKRRGID